MVTTVDKKSREKTQNTVEAKRPSLFAARIQEVVAFCPKCKTLETLWLAESQLLPTQKFSQKDNRIFHNCGSDKPCRLYGLF